MNDEPITRENWQKKAREYLSVPVRVPMPDTTHLCINGECDHETVPLLLRPGHPNFVMDGQPRAGRSSLDIDWSLPTWATPDRELRNAIPTGYPTSIIEDLPPIRNPRRASFYRWLWRNTPTFRAIANWRWNQWPWVQLVDDDDDWGW